MEIAGLLRAIYDQEGNQFSDTRADILEAAVHYFGSKKPDYHKFDCFIEPEIVDQVEDELIVVGESDIKCDFVYFRDELTPMDFIECKADIGNMIPVTKPFEKAKKSHQKKVLYLANAYDYLSLQYAVPRIFFACYNLNYDQILKNLQQNWGYAYMNFMNADEIINGKKSF